jgi:hypothetical protein
MQSQLKLISLINKPLVPVAAQSKARIILDPSNSGIVGLYPACDMFTCSRLFVLCCPV